MQRFLRSKIATNTHNIINFLCKYFFVSFIICRFSAVSSTFFGRMCFEWDWTIENKKIKIDGKRTDFSDIDKCLCVVFFFFWLMSQYILLLYDMNVCKQSNYMVVTIFWQFEIRICCNLCEKIQIKRIFQWTVAKNNIPIPWLDLSNGKICMNCANKHQLTFPLPQPLKYSYMVWVWWWYILMRQFNLYLFR